MSLHANANSFAGWPNDDLLRLALVSGWCKRLQGWQYHHYCLYNYSNKSGFVDNNKNMYA